MSFGSLFLVSLCLYGLPLLQCCHWNAMCAACPPPMKNATRTLRNVQRPSTCAWLSSTRSVTAATTDSRSRTKTDDSCGPDCDDRCVFWNSFEVGVCFPLPSRLRKVHREAVRQPADVQQRLLVGGLQRRRKRHQLLQHSWPVQLQRGQVRSHAHIHTPAAVDRWGVTSPVTLKEAPSNPLICPKMKSGMRIWTCVYSDANLSLHLRRIFKNPHKTQPIIFNSRYILKPRKNIFHFDIYFIDFFLFDMMANFAQKTK